METNKKSIYVIALSLVILVIGGIAYYAKKNANPVPQNQNGENNSPVNQTGTNAQGGNTKLRVSDQSKNAPSVYISNENSSAQVFKKQPAAIKSITLVAINQKWTMGLDFLTRNRNWNSSSGNVNGYFVNENDKIRYFTITNATKTYRCHNESSILLVGTANFILSVGNIIEGAKINPKLAGEFGYTAYFDINGENITAIYERCYP